MDLINNIETFLSILADSTGLVGALVPLAIYRMMIILKNQNQGTGSLGKLSESGYRQFG